MAISPRHAEGQTLIDEYLEVDRVCWNMKNIDMAMLMRLYVSVHVGMLGRVRYHLNGIEQILV